MRSFIITIFLLVMNVSLAQTSTYWGTKSHVGFVIPHSPELKSVANDTPFGIQLEWSKLKIGDEAWQTCNCYGRSGVSFAYFNYNNPNALGASYNLNYFAEPYLSFKNAFKISLRSSVGVNYLTRVFDEQTNPDNLFFSAPISFYLQLGLGFNYDVGESSNLNMMLNYNHISNGGQKQPNKGMNFPTVSIGYDYIINKKPLEEKAASLKAYDPEWWSYLVLFGSFRSIDESSAASSYLRSGLSYGVSRPFSRISNLTGGVEVGYDASFNQIIENQALNESPIVASLLAGHHFSFGRIHFLTQIGAYISRPKTIQPKSIFQNYSLWYFVSDRVGVGTALIAYGHVADHMDVRVVYKIAH